MTSFTVLGTLVEYRDGSWVSSGDIGQLVTGFHQLYLAMPHEYSPSPIADFIEWLGKYLPVADVNVAQATSPSGNEVY